MKNIIMTTVLALLAACNSEPGKSNESDKKSADTMQTINPVPATTTSGDSNTNTVSPLKSILGSYFDLKNALTNDDGKGAAVAGKAIVETMNKLDTSILSQGQNKIYRDLKDDLLENAEHIGANPDKIEHQREHFEMLSKDIYDLLKAGGAGQTVYQDYCPMYNNGKGATWVSETREIKNPYLGKKMPTCGSVKEEFK